MSKSQFDEFSPVLKAFLGYLVYENSDKLTEFIEENKAVFSDFPELAIDALIEISFLASPG